MIKNTDEEHLPQIAERIKTTTGWKLFSLRSQCHYQLLSTVNHTLLFHNPDWTRPQSGSSIATVRVSTDHNPQTKELITPQFFMSST